MKLLAERAPGRETEINFEPDLGAVLQAMGAEQPLEALNRCQALLKTAPHDGRLHLLVGLLLRQAGRQAEAVPWLRRAVELRPQSEEALTMLAGAYEASGDKPAAVVCLTRCLRLNPTKAEAWFKLGNLCHQLGDNERAASLYEKASRLEPNNQKIWNNLGKALRDLGRLEPALAAYDQALAVEPDNAFTHCNRAITLMVGGRLQEGLREYEWRRRALCLRQYAQTIWKGERLPGKTLLLSAEQGYGDMIQFARFVSLARQRAGRVILECRPALARLMDFSDLADEVWETGQPLPEFDYYSPLMSLPALFGTRLETIPGPNAYLKTPPPGPLALPETGHLNVGLVWAGNPEHAADAERSVPLETLRPLLELEGVRCVNLQVPAPAPPGTRSSRSAGSPAPAELELHAAWPPGLPHLTSPPLPLRNFYDTAAVMGQLDLVVSVDTAAAHLAGALGKPVWTLIHRFPDWRWLLTRGDTPWYPTMRLFRQPPTGEWRPVIENVASELVSMAWKRQTGPQKGKPSTPAERAPAP